MARPCNAIYAIVSVLLALVGKTADAFAEKPTREAIIALSAQCSKEKRQLDLISTFGTDYSGLDLSGVDFRGYHAVGYSPNIAGADFSRCNLTNAQFGAAILDGADFTDANLEGASFVTARMRNVVMLTARLDGARFVQCDFSRANLACVDFSGADISGSHFSAADLEYAQLAGIKDEIAANDFSSARLRGANLSGLNLRGAQFINADLSGADLSDAVLERADFSGAILADTTLTGAILTHADFNGVQGLTAQVHEGLIAQSQRRKLDVRRSLDGFWRDYWRVIWGSLYLALAVLIWIALAKHPPAMLAVITGSIAMLAALPSAYLGFLLSQGGSPVAQISSGGDDTMLLWSTWFHMWPLFMLFLLACLVACIGLAIASVARLAVRGGRRRVITILVAVLSLAHVVIALNFVAKHFPDA
jgi:uncharacterized protein YjbI with pentapeptide repeats